ncbi:MAG: GDYXXLXY domain-containing protein [Verrucomicrobiota bacterium]
MTPRMLIFIPLAVIQLAVPGWIIYRQEQILHHGREFKFQTAPVDPYDAFRGRYVALQFAVVPPPDYTVRDRKIWVRFEADENGFAKIKEVCETPLAGDDVVMATRRYGRLQFPFDRYYMEEMAAPKAETTYRANSRSEHQNAYATVRVLNGHAAIEELYIEHKPIREFLRTESDK